MKRVVIVGGGIAGLAAAHHLLAAETGLDLTLVEGETRLGGKIVTERAGGFVIEGGPDSFLAARPHGLGLCRELGLEDRLQGADETTRRAFVMRDGRLHELPEGLSGLIPSRLGPMLRTRLISPGGRLRMGLDLLIPPRAAEEDESLAAFVGRRLGREAYERLIEPLMGGIYAGDGEQLSLAATFPQLRRLERDHGGLIRGMLATRDRTQPVGANGAKRPAFLALRGGMAELVEALAGRLGGAAIRLGRPAVRVEGRPPGWHVALAGGESLPAEAVILAAPAYVTADLLAGVDPAMSAALRAIPYTSTATVSVAYRNGDLRRPLDGHGYLIPRREGRPALACTWTSAKFPGRAPGGYSLIRAFFGRAGGQATGPDEASDDDLLRWTRDELGRTLGLTAAPVFHRIFRWPRAMPQYTLGHLERVARVEAALPAHPGLFVAGNAYRGVGLPDCIASGEAAAGQAIEFLNRGAE